jgi:hypothetical protein
MGQNFTLNELAGANRTGAFTVAGKKAADSIVFK